MRHLLPRLLLVLLAVPPIFAATALTAATLGGAPEGPASIVGAMAFAAVTLAPSHRNAAMRALVFVLVVALVGLLTLAARA